MQRQNQFTFIICKNNMFTLLLQCWYLDFKLGITILMLGQVDYIQTRYKSAIPIKVNVQDTMTG
jgi:hypothetical protein